MRSSITVLLGLYACSVSSHSYVSSIAIEGLAYHGFTPKPPVASRQPPLNTDGVVGWSTTAFDQGYVDPALNDADLICHRNAQSTPYHAPIRAGESIHVQWNGWPEGHKGPVLSYLAFCGNSTGCEAVSKAELAFFKIEETGLITNATASNSPTARDINTSADTKMTESPHGSLADMNWASDLLIANNNSWVIPIPERLRPGFYVLRHEIIALHNASIPNGSQNYPQCLNLEILPGVRTPEQGGSGGEVDVLPVGVPGRQLYDAKGRDKESLELDIYAPLNESGRATYRNPGPGVALKGRDVGLSHPLPTGGGTPVLAG